MISKAVAVTGLIAASGLLCFSIPLAEAKEDTAKQTIGGLPCGDGQVAKFSAGTGSWVCTPDDDEDDALSAIVQELAESLAATQQDLATTQAALAATQDGLADAEQMIEGLESEVLGLSEASRLFAHLALGNTFSQHKRMATDSVLDSEIDELNERVHPEEFWVDLAIEYLDELLNLQDDGDFMLLVTELDLESEWLLLRTEVLETRVILLDGSVGCIPGGTCIGLRKVFAAGIMAVIYRRTADFLNEVSRRIMNRTMEISLLQARVELMKSINIRLAHLLEDNL
jgi:hypothetical protein